MLSTSLRSASVARMDDRQEQIALPIDADPLALEALHQGSGDVRAVNAVQVGALVVDLRSQHLDSLPPVGADRLGVGLGVQSLGRLAREPAKDVGVGPAEARLDLAGRSRAELKRGGVGEGFGIGLGEIRLDCGYQPIDRLGVDDVHQHLGVGGVELLRRIRQQKAESPFAEQRADVGDTLLLQ